MLHEVLACELKLFVCDSIMTNRVSFHRVTVLQSIELAAVTAITFGSGWGYILLCRVFFPPSRVMAVSRRPTPKLLSKEAKSPGKSQEERAGRRRPRKFTALQVRIASCDPAWLCWWQQEELFMTFLRWLIHNYTSAIRCCNIFRECPECS